MTSGAAVKRQVGDDPEGKRERHAEDFYRTGEIATRALLAVERFPGTVWECACGDGAMSRVIERESVGTTHVLSTDLVDRGYGTPGLDFLRCPAAIGIDHVVTNPPFRLVDEFVLRAIELRPPGKVALIARTLLLEGTRRRKAIFDRFPPARVWVFPYRIPMTRGDFATPRIGLMSFSWFVWEAPFGRGPTTLDWLPRPEEPQ